MANISLAAVAIILSGAAAAILWCLLLLVYQIVHKLVRADEERCLEEKAYVEVEDRDVGKYVPPGPGDDRSPCPALNAMANHGYLPRHGRNISGRLLVHALQRTYGLSRPLAFLLAYGGLLLLGQAGPISLADTARHNRIEHNASLVHRDTDGGRTYAPIEVDETMWATLVEGVEVKSDGLGVRDLARRRVAREAESDVGGGTTPIGREVARGEMALVFNIFGQDASTMTTSTGVAKAERKIPLDTLTKFMREERLPEGWKPMRQTTLLQTVKRAREIRLTMVDVRKRENLTA